MNCNCVTKNIGDWICSLNNSVIQIDDTIEILENCKAQLHGVRADCQVLPPGGILKIQEIQSDPANLIEFTTPSQGEFKITKEGCYLVIYNVSVKALRNKRWNSLGLYSPDYDKLFIGTSTEDCGCSETTMQSGIGFIEHTNTENVFCFINNSTNSDIEIKSTPQDQLIHSGGNASAGFDMIIMYVGKVN